MKNFSRAERVAGQIQKVLSDILLRDSKDPRLKSATVTGVKMTRDLKIARVYFAVSGGPSRREEVMSGFESAGGYLKRALAAELSLRYMPDLTFFYDESFDYGDHIDRLLKQLNTENGSNHTALET
jgi:ribosome-binding factor A